MEQHEMHMRHALELAERGWGRVSPNPMVGAVIVREGRVVGTGWHEGPGTDHAEVMALHEAGALARGAVVCCTLEPCNRIGRTPPCTQALIEAGVAQVIAATTDPNLGTDAPGLAELRAAGIGTSVGPLQDEARRLNEAFEHHVGTGRPFVTLKMAASLDGKSAAADGTSRWITGEAARVDVHRRRAGADAVVVGAGTAVADDPELTVRHEQLGQAHHPMRVMVDASGRVPPSARMFVGGNALVATTDRAARSSREAWSASGAEVLVLDRDRDGEVSLTALIETLGKRDVQGVLVEGGPTLAWGFVREGLIDKVVLYLAPKLIGGKDAPGVLGGVGFAPVTDALDLTVASVTPLGPDLRVEAYVHRDH